MSETSAGGGRILKLIIAWLPVAAAVIGALWAGFLYFDGRAEKAREAQAVAARQAAEARMKAEQPLAERKLKLLTEAASVAATLASAPMDSEAWKAAEARFLSLYLGELSTVEGPDVEDRMVKFRRALDAHKTEPTPETAHDLEQASVRLARAVRAELGTP